MLCGTPVVASPLGAVPEIVEEGVSGFTATNHDERVRVIARCFDLDRRRIHERAAQRFSAEHMARNYLRVYEQAASRK